MKQSLFQSGLSPRAGAKPQSSRALISNTPRLSSSASNHANDCAAISLAFCKAKRRRAAAAAQAHARRRAVIGLALALLGLISSVAVQEREAQMQGQQVEVGK
jgi:hypothetical protein